MLDLDRGYVSICCCQCQSAQALYTTMHQLDMERSEAPALHRTLRRQQWYHCGPCSFLEQCPALVRSGYGATKPTHSKNVSKSSLSILNVFNSPQKTTVQVTFGSTLFRCLVNWKLAEWELSVAFAMCGGSLLSVVLLRLCGVRVHRFANTCVNLVVEL